MLKKSLVALVIGTLFLGSALMAGKPLNKSHKGKLGKDGAKINCVYCHKTAGNPKTEGNDLVALKKGPFCSFGECHK